jgi:hypothetical protein
VKYLNSNVFFSQLIPLFYQSMKMVLIVVQGIKEKFKIQLVLFESVIFKTDLDFFEKILYNEIIPCFLVHDSYYLMIKIIHLIFKLRYY